jgi:hypothetical protein
MAYLDNIVALSPDHLWKFDGDLVDVVGSNNGTGTAIDYSGITLCEDATTNSVRMNDKADRISVATSPNIDQVLSQKTVCGWFQVTEIQLPPKNIYREGANGNGQFNIVLWAGNKVMLDVVNGTTVNQVFSDNIFKVNRTYHITAVFSGSAFNNEVALYIDGVKQSISVPSNGEPNYASLPLRTAANWGLPTGTSQVGDGNVQLNACVSAYHNFWATFSGSDLTPTQIREELFEKGAKDGVTISNQSGLDAIANSVRPDEPLNIRVADNGGDLTLTADNITHDPLASIHIQWMGTGTLTYVNTNGSNASIFSTPNGGTVTIVNPAVLTISPLVANTEVRVYDAGTMTELGGIEDSGTSFSVSIQSSSVDVVVHNVGYEYIRVDSIDMTSGNVDLPVSQIFDRNYENP